MFSGTLLCKLIGYSVPEVCDNELDSLWMCGGKEERIFHHP